MRAPQSVRTQAKTLRRSLSLPEVLLWRELKRSAGDGPQFRKQHPLGPYVLDFFCARAQLCVEVDGASHGTDDRPARDDRRDAYLKSVGVHVERIAAISVLQDPYAVAYGVRLLAAARTAARSRGPLSQLR